MYNVVNDIKSLKFIFLEENSTNLIPFDNIKVRLIGTPESSSELLSEVDTEEWNTIYNNIVLSGGRLEGDLVLLQDYGDHEGYLCSDDEIEVPRAILFLSDRGSIGQYQGKLYYFIVAQNTLVGYKLSNCELGDLRSLRDKRPFNFITYIESGDDVYNQIVKFKLVIHLYDADNYYIKGDLGRTYAEFVNPVELESVIRCILNESRDLGVIDIGKYITTDYLIDDGFSYDSINTEFRKKVNQKEIVIKYDRGYFLVDDDYIFTIDELHSLINK